MDTKTYYVGWFNPDGTMRLERRVIAPPAMSIEAVHAKALLDMIPVSIGRIEFSKRFNRVLEREEFRGLPLEAKEAAFISGFFAKPSNGYSSITWIPDNLTLLDLTGGKP